MTPDPLVSIVVPVFNRLVYLPETIDGILRQRYDHWELIVVDDGSTDDVESIILGYSDRRIYFIRQENQGNAAARNTGINEAKGDCICCLDSDDVWQPDMLECSLQVLRERPEVDVVYTQVQWIDAAGELIPRPPSPRALSGNLLQPMLMGHPIVPSSAVVRRNCFERWGAFKPGLDDWEMWLRWSLNGCHIHCIATPLVLYRVHDQNLFLDWDRRRQVHFTMLDEFYSGVNLPETVLRMKPIVYANQHRFFAILAWRTERQAEALDEIMDAVAINPTLLKDVEFYYELACAHQSRVDSGTKRNFDLDEADQILRKSLDAVYDMDDPETEGLIPYPEARAWADYTLGKLAYSISRDMVRARRYFSRSIRYWPKISLTAPWFAWFLRTVIGFDRIQRLKLLAFTQKYMRNPHA